MPPTLAEMLPYSVPSATKEYCFSASCLIGQNLRALHKINDHQTAPANTGEDENSDGDGKRIAHPQADYSEWFLSLASQLLDTHHPGFFPTNSDRANDACGVNLPCCKDCGAALQPGYKGTSIRIRSVPKNLRKRQPKTKNSTSNKNPRFIVAKDPLSAWKATVMASSSKAKKSWKQNVCRNEIVLTCGTCKKKTVYPGLPPRSKEENFVSSNATKPKVDAPAKKDWAVYKMNKEVQQPLDDNLDFVPLGEPNKHVETSRAKVQENAEAAKKRKQTSSPLLPLQSQKKRPKKKPASKLLDFLSSLND